MSYIVTCCSGQVNALTALEFPSCLLISKLCVGGNNQHRKAPASYSELDLVREVPCSLHAFGFALTVCQMPFYQAVS